MTDRFDAFSLEELVELKNGLAMAAKNNQVNWTNHMILWEEISRAIAKKNND